MEVGSDEFHRPWWICLHRTPQVGESMVKQEKASLLLWVILERNQLNPSMLNNGDQLFQVAQLELMAHRCHEDC